MVEVLSVNIDRFVSILRLFVYHDISSCMLHKWINSTVRCNLNIASLSLDRSKMATRSRINGTDVTLVQLASLTERFQTEDKQQIQQRPW